MSAEEQWEEAYRVAEQMYTNNCAIKRTELNPYSQVVCSRYKTIFSYDPYEDEYEFINQELTFDQPIIPRIRTIAETDLDTLKENSVKCQLDSPAYYNITPIYVVPPSVVLAFNNSQPPADGLSEALAEAATSLTLNPTDAEVTPGAEFVFKHKNGKCYRCIVISELGDENVPEGDRRYEVAFLDFCQIVPVKLKTLFIPVNIGMEKFTCALHCIRLLGISAFRNGFVSHYNNEVREFYNDRQKRKDGLNALLYKTSKTEKKLIMDFPSIHGNSRTNSEETKLQHGHHSIATKDPIGLPYEQLMNSVIRPLEYSEQEENSENKDENIHGNAKQKETTEDEVDLSDCDQNSNKLPISIKDVAKADCPQGMASIAKFMQAKNGQLGNTSTKATVAPLCDTSFSSSLHPSTVVQPQNSHQGEHSENLDDTRNDSISSLRSGTINQTSSANTTPQPTFEAIDNKEEMTPKKETPKFDGSSDGWGDDTPKKEEVVKPIQKKQWDGGDQFGKTQKPLRFQKPSSTADVNSQNTSVLPTPKIRTCTPLSIPRPLSPTPQIEYDSLLKAGKPVASLLNMKITTPEKFKSSETNGIPLKNTVSDNIENSLPTVKNNGSHAFGCPPSETKNHSENGSSMVRVERKQSELEDEVFNATKNSGSLQKAVRDSNIGFQDANISKESSNQNLINSAQDNFHDSDVEGWETKSEKAIEGTQLPGAIAPKPLSADEKNFSEKSICSGDFGDDKCRNTEEMSHLCPEIIDEFAEVPENLKQIANSYIDAIRQAALQKNHNAYIMEIISLELLSQKMPNDLDKRYMRAKATEAKDFDQAFN